MIFSNSFICWYQRRNSVRRKMTVTMFEVDVTILNHHCQKDTLQFSNVSNSPVCVAANNKAPFTAGSQRLSPHLSKNNTGWPLMLAVSLSVTTLSRGGMCRPLRHLHI